MSTELPVVTIVGRPNVGKSTLFNRLAGKTLALVDDRPGVTRDRREAPSQLADLTFTLVDTAGLEEAAADSLEGRMRAQTDVAVARGDVVLFVVDARLGITPVDEAFANQLRGAGAPVIVVANKCEGRHGMDGVLEAHGLGFGDPVPLSAAHGEGLALLHEMLAPLLEQAREDLSALEALEEDEDEDKETPPLALAVVGRPNVGKSTLVNRLVGEERMVTGPEPGVTRDAIPIPWTWNGQPVRLVDTAGLRRRSQVTDPVERASAQATRRAIRLAQVVVLVLDATEEMGRQDLAIAREVVDEGRALVVAANKWDAVTDPRETKRKLLERLEDSLPQIRGVPLVPLSARTGNNIPRLMAAVMEVRAVWDSRIGTSRLNQWLETMTEAHPPPLAGTGRRVKVRYMTQAKSRPPTFIAFVNRPEDLPESYLRYLVNGLRNDFDLMGVPVRLRTRKGDNPYKGRK